MKTLASLIGLSSRWPMLRHRRTVRWKWGVFWRWRSARLNCHPSADLIGALANSG